MAGLKVLTSDEMDRENNIARLWALQRELNIQGGLSGLMGAPIPPEPPAQVEAPMQSTATALTQPPPSPSPPPPPSPSPRPPQLNDRASDSTSPPEARGSEADGEQTTSTSVPTGPTPTPALPNAVEGLELGPGTSFDLPALAASIDMDGWPQWVKDHFSRFMSETVDDAHKATWLSVLSGWVALEKEMKFENPVRLQYELYLCSISF